MNRKSISRLLCFAMLLFSVLLAAGCSVPDVPVSGVSSSASGIPAEVQTGEPAEPSSLPARSAEQPLQAVPDEPGPSAQVSPSLRDEPAPEASLPEEDGVYTTAEDVALYLHTYGHLPDNFITKKQAQALGWPGGNLEPYAPGKCIGGSYFGNYQEQLPEKEGREYHECDIDTLGAKSRGAKRLVYSNDGLIYYTEDHYETFTLLYGEPDS